jgi:hypothetical protein
MLAKNREASSIGVREIKFPVAEFLLEDHPSRADSRP